MVRLLCLGVWLAMSGLAHGQLGKWVDTRGRVYYGDQPPQVPVKEELVSRGSVSMAEGAHFKSAPVRWSSRQSGGGSYAGIVGAPAESSAGTAQPRGGYWRCE